MPAIHTTHDVLETLCDPNLNNFRKHLQQCLLIPGVACRPVSGHDPAVAAAQVAASAAAQVGVGTALRNPAAADMQMGVSCLAALRSPKKLWNHLQ